MNDTSVSSGSSTATKLDILREQQTIVRQRIQKIKEMLSRQTTTNKHTVNCLQDALSSLQYQHDLLTYDIAEKKHVVKKNVSIVQCFEKELERESRRKKPYRPKNVNQRFHNNRKRYSHTNAGGGSKNFGSNNTTTTTKITMKDRAQKIIQYLLALKATNRNGKNRKIKNHPLWTLGEYSVLGVSIPKNMKELDDTIYHLENKFITKMTDEGNRKNDTEEENTAEEETKEEDTKEEETKEEI